jgi:CO dehydrogenase nickel-insertion accessory protein CooC1
MNLGHKQNLLDRLGNEMVLTKFKQNKLILSGKRIGFFGKGGAGKSTVVVLLANGLKDYGYEVCVLDADSTNMGLPQVLGIEQSPQPLMEYFGGMIFSGGQVSCPVDDPTPLPDSHLSLEDLPPQYYRQSKSGITFITAGKLGGQGPGSGCDGPISKIARDFRISIHEKAPVMLVDFKAGFEEIARGVITSLDWAIMIVDPTIAAIEMAGSMRDMVNEIKKGTLPATHHLINPDLVTIANQQYLDARIKGVMYLINKIENKQTEIYLRAKLAERCIEPAGVLYADPAISISWLKGTTMMAHKSQDAIPALIGKLEIAESLATTNSKSTYSMTHNDPAIY